MSTLKFVSKYTMRSKEKDVLSIYKKIYHPYSTYYPRGKFIVFKAAQSLTVI
jgi:hypothetical protein